MGRISIWDLHTDTGTLKSVCHFEEEVSGADTVTIVTDSTSHQNTWSYVFPGKQYNPFSAEKSLDVRI